MAVAGSLTYDTKIDKNGFEKGLNSLQNAVESGASKIKNIVTALGITKLITTAINTINNSIDGAISRLDTLNNYPKVMSNLGIASEDAQKSIEKMSDKLSGLPTTLDQGALAVQRITSKNGDINKSTDYFLALNNAILAGGASADIQSSALEQLSQAYAKGKPDMMEWRTLQMAMPAQLKQVANAMGMTTEALGAGLRGAEKDVAYLRDVTMEEFMDTIVRLNTEGTEGFQSFEEQARNSTGGIATAITVAKTQIVKGVTDIIQSFDEFLKSEGLGGISEIISNIGKKAKEVLDIVAEKLPDVINSIKEILPYLKEMLPYLSGIGIIFASWKIGSTIQGIVQNFQKAQVALSLYTLETNGASIAQGLFNGTLTLAETLVGLFTGKVTLAEIASAGLAKAQAVLNGVMSANPIMLIVLAIGALIAVFVVLWNKCEWFRNFWIGIWEAVSSFFVNVWNAIVNFFTQTIPMAFQSVLDFFVNIGNSIGTFFENLWNGIINFFTQTIPQWIQNVIQWFKELPYNIGFIIGEIIGHIIKFGIDAWNWVTTELPKIIENIINWFAELPGNIWNWLTETINNIVNWGIQVYQTASQWVSDTINSIINWFAELPSNIWNWLVHTITNIVIWIANMRAKVDEGISNIVNGIINWFKELPDNMLNIGKNIVEGLWNGIKNAGQWIIDKVKEFAKGILDGMKNALGIQSPSKVFRDQVGKFIPQGIAVGIEADTDEAVNSLKNMNNEIMQEMNRAVAFETGSINAKASVKSNNSMLNVIQATFNVDGSVNMDKQKVGTVVAPVVTKTIKVGGFA